MVERRKAYSYVTGGIFGLLTALFTGFVWTAQFISYWGLEMLTIPIVSYLVVLVFGLVMIAGVIAGFPIMYGRKLGLQSG